MPGNGSKVGLWAQVWFLLWSVVVARQAVLPWPSMRSAWAATLALALATAGSLAPAAALAGSARDREQVEANIAAFMSALSRGAIDEAMGFLAEDFSGYTPTGEYVKNREEYKAYLVRVRTLAGIGRGGSFTSRILGKDLSLDGGRVDGTISTHNEIRTPQGDVIPWHQSFPVNMVQGPGGRWLLKSADARMSLRDKVTVAVKAVAGRIWRGGLTLRAPKAERPDFDSDGGDYQAGVSAASVAGLEVR